MPKDLSPKFISNLYTTFMKFFARILVDSNFVFRSDLKISVSDLAKL